MPRSLLCKVFIEGCTENLDYKSLLKTMKNQSNSVMTEFLNLSLWPDRKQESELENDCKNPSQ